MLQGFKKNNQTRSSESRRTVNKHYCSFLFVVSVLFRYVFLCSPSSFVDVPLIFFCPADHEADWRVLCAGFLVSYRAAFLVLFCRSVLKCFPNRNIYAAFFADRFSNVSLTGTYTPSFADRFSNVSLTGTYTPSGYSCTQQQ